LKRASLTVKALPLSNPRRELKLAHERSIIKGLFQWLTEHIIEAKMLFAENILKHRGHKGINCRVAKKLTNSSHFMRDSFFVEVYPGMSEEKMKYMMGVFREFVSRNK
jgi:CDP-6-deoxy-D-xylo-4-hexulose-3-dehydrase